MPMYPYITLSDDTLITHSHLIENDNGEKSVEIHFERPSKANFLDSARCSLPSYEWITREGYSDEEILNFETMLRHAAHIFFQFAAQGGAQVAKAI